MNNRPSVPRKAVARVFVPVLFAVALVFTNVTSAIADQTGDIIGGFVNFLVNAALIKSAQKSWKKVSVDIQSCLVSTYNINPEQLVQNGIRADDGRVAPYIQACQQALAQAQLRQQEAERNRIAQEAAQREAEQAAAQEAQRRADEDAAQRAAAKAARLESLKQRFAADWVPKIVAGDVELGWNRDAVRESLGAPREMVRTPTGEMWIYASRKVIFTGDRVTYVGA